MMREPERVALTLDLPEYHVKAGDMGTAVGITSDDREATIEFSLWMAKPMRSFR